MGKGRAPCCDKSKVKKGPWSPAEDLKLITFIQKNGHDNWRALPKQSGLLRCGKSCRLRWINYLRPDVKRGNFSQEEEENIIKLHQTLGNKWSKIASHFPGRTDNEIKNVWNTHLKKRILKITDPSGDESNKEYSIVTSSSSSSTSSILSSRKRDSKEVVVEKEEFGHKRKKIICDSQEYGEKEEEEDDEDDDSAEKGDEINCRVFSTQVEKNPNDQATLDFSTTTSSDSSYGSNISNGSSTTTAPITGTQVVNGSKLGDHEEETLMDTLLLEFQGPYDVNSILKEANQPDQAMMSLLDENEDGFWDMFSDNTTLFKSNNHEVQVLSNNLHDDEISFKSSDFGEEKNLETASNNDWFRYLESELGLEATTLDNKHQIEQAFDQDYYHAMTTTEELLAQGCDFSDIDPKPEFEPCLETSASYDLWPINMPQNSSAI